MKIRRRFRQTITLEERLADEAKRLRDEAKKLPPGQGYAARRSGGDRPSTNFRKASSSSSIHR